MVVATFCCLVTGQLSDVMKLEDAQKICHQQAVVERGLSCIQLVYGAAGKCMTAVFID